MTRAAIYARVSSAAQRDAHTIESQLHLLRPLVERNSWTLVDTLLDDGRSAKTGALAKRDGYARLLALVNAGELDVIATAAVDRLTRTEDLLELAAILGPLQRAKVKIVSPTFGEIDLSTEHGRMAILFQASYAASENARRSDRIKAGKARAIAEGRKPAGPTPYGWTYSREGGQWGLDELAAAATREAFARVIAGESCLAIADDYHARGIAAPGGGEWTRHKVWQIVTKRRAVGEWTVDKRKRLTITIPQIVDRATWQVAQAALAQHGKRGLARTQHVYLLEGLGTCGNCGGPIHIRSSSPGRRGTVNPAAYICRDRKVARRGRDRCDAPILRVDEIDARVWGVVQSTLESPDLARKVEARARAAQADRQGWESDVKRYRERLEWLVQAEAAIAARWRRGLLSDAAFDLDLEASARDRATIEAQLRAAQDGARASAAGVLLVDATAWVAEIRGLARSLSPEDRQRVVRAVVRPGARFVDGQVELELVIATPTPAPAARPCLAVAPGYRRHHEQIARDPISIRLVA